MKKAKICKDYEGARHEELYRPDRPHQSALHSLTEAFSENGCDVLVAVVARKIALTRVMAGLGLVADGEDRVPE